MYCHYTRIGRWTSSLVFNIHLGGKTRVVEGGEGEHGAGAGAFDPRSITTKRLREWNDNNYYYNYVSNKKQGIHHTPSTSQLNSTAPTPINTQPQQQQDQYYNQQYYNQQQPQQPQAYYNQQDPQQYYQNQQQYYQTSPTKQQMPEPHYYDLNQRPPRQ